MRKKTFRALAFASAAILVATLTQVPSRAASGVQIITPYPSVVTQAGKTVTLNLDVITPTRQRVALSITDVPKGWQATLRGGGFVIKGVFGSPKTKDESPPQVQLEVRVPPDAAQATYKVVVKGTSSGGSSVLPVEVTVSETAAGAVTLVPEFPSQRGAATDTFTFTVTLTNNTPDKTSFSLAASGPEGWDVSAKPSTEQRATTVAVDGGSTATVNVSADPPDTVTAGTYPIKVTATGEGKTAEAALSVDITGSFKLDLNTANERLSAKAVAGKATELAMVIHNTGTADLENVKFTSSPPTKWRVTFRPEEVATVKAGETGKVTALISPSGDAVAGDYSVNITGSAGGATDSAEIRVTVSTSRFAGFVGLLLLVAVVAAVMWVFRRYGRR